MRQIPPDSAGTRICSSQWSIHRVSAESMAGSWPARFCWLDPMWSTESLRNVPHSTGQHGPRRRRRAHQMVCAVDEQLGGAGVLFIWKVPQPVAPSMRWWFLNEGLDVPIYIYIYLYMYRWFRCILWWLLGFLSCSALADCAGHAANAATRLGPGAKSSYSLHETDSQYIKKYKVISLMQSYATSDGG